jgi:hypothetical protein
MAKSVQLKHKDSGVMKTGYYGFSWTTLFFGCFPALFRGDFLTFMGIFVVLFLIGLVTLGIGTFIAMFVWAFFYNGYYTKKLLEKGYVFSDFQSVTEEAARKLGVSITNANETPKPSHVRKQSEPVSSTQSSSRSLSFTNEEKTLVNDAYKIYLVKKYPLEFNDVLKKYIYKDKLFESVDAALVAVHQDEIDSELLAARSESILSKLVNKNEAISFLALMGVKVLETDDGKFTVTEKNSTHYFYSESELLQYVTMKANESKKGGLRIFPNGNWQCPICQTENAAPIGTCKSCDNYIVAKR